MPGRRAALCLQGLALSRPSLELMSGLWVDSTGEGPLWSLWGVAYELSIHQDYRIPSWPFSSHLDLNLHTKGWPSLEPLTMSREHSPTPVACILTDG